ncbi:PRD domain-containing protein [Isobaculum melis]|nr:PRD domain-containing protein [Isobaculum melis]
MLVEQRINNNVVLANENGEKLIVMGKGIGFKVYPKDLVKKNLIEQTFIPKPDSDFRYMVEMLKGIPMDELSVSKQIVDQAEKLLATKLSPNLVVTLSDHIHFSLQRFADNIHLIHPLEWEIMQYYQKEMKVAEEALATINLQLKTNLPPSEISFLTMHFVNAQLDFSEKYESGEMTEMIMQIVKIIMYHFQITINQQTNTFARFVTHLRYYLIRQLKQEHDQNKLDSELIQIVKMKYPAEYRCAEKIADYLEKNYQSHSTENELVYLSLHINRLVIENQAK